ncbi:MAG TPA: hypothetical protein ENJ61_00335 [Aquifex aeolicus]|uniref:Conjugal transfer protein TraN n=1 Tax=Aquifex aeolicus TaxID=63363 RepID=A0A7C5Q1L0_AQUAO|nr:hypothetical protein [Aquifex aeolicus]
MLKRAGVKLSLYSLLVLVFLWSCGPTGSGDAYRSEVYSAEDPQYRGGVEVSRDRKSVRIYGDIPCYGSYSRYAGQWISIQNGGTSEFTERCRNWWRTYTLEIRNGQLRIYYRTAGSSGIYGDWIPLCPQGGGVSRAEPYLVETNSGNSIRFCHFDQYQNRWVCGRWAAYVCPPECPSGYTYDSSLNLCTADPAYICPSGYTYNSSTEKCERAPNTNRSCPFNPNRPCIQEGSGYFCSPYDCYDAASTPPVNTDTRQGANDVPADGQVTEEGCVGTVYVFNGRDMRCRPPGTQTGFSNCCRKTTTWFGLGRCSEAERQLASLRSWGQLDGNCHYVGEYCAEEWFDVCVQKKRTYCCFSSPLARIIHEQGRPQLGIGWGTPQSPNCRGFTMQEFQKLDFSKIDFSEWVEEEVRKNIAPSIETNIQNVINQIPSQIQGQ